MTNHVVRLFCRNGVEGRGGAQAREERRRGWQSRAGLFRVRDVWQGVLALLPLDFAHAHAFRGETPRLSDVRQGVLALRQPGCAHAHAYR